MDLVPVVADQSATAMLMPRLKVSVPGGLVTSMWMRSAIRV